MATSKFSKSVLRFFFIQVEPNFYLRQLAMNLSVCGCGMSFMPGGLRSHQRQSHDIRCQNGPQFDDCDDCDKSEENMDIDSDPQNLITDVLKNMVGVEHIEFEVDPAGDLFGDYQNYIPEEFGMDRLDSNVSDDESEGANDEERYFLTENSEILEPERTPPSDSFLSGPLPDTLDPDNVDLTTNLKASHLRGGAEEVLRKRPFIVKFTKGKAGATYRNQRVDGNNLNTSYRRNIANTENPSPYSPFSSKLEWEIAQWAKMRGPSSTAFNELLEIEGVSIISCQAVYELS